MAFAKRRLRLAVGLALLVAECAARASLLAGAAPACDATQPVSFRGRAAQRVGRIVSRTVHALTQHEALQPFVDRASRIFGCSPSRLEETYVTRYKSGEYQRDHTGGGPSLTTNERLIKILIAT